MKIQLEEKAVVQFDKMQKGDVKNTFADINYSKDKLKFEPATDIKSGIPKFVEWYLNYKGIQKKR